MVQHIIILQRKKENLIEVDYFSRDYSPSEYTNGGIKNLREACKKYNQQESPNEYYEYFLEENIPSCLLNSHKIKNNTKKRFYND